MNFTIKGPVITIPEKISIRQPLFIIGSCFAENIGAHLKEHLFDVDSNPFGIVYNPLSIFKQLQRIAENNPFSATELVEANGLFHSWEHHGSFSNAIKGEVIRNINTRLQSAHHNLKAAEWLIITLGSAYYYRLKENNKIVSNCHKVPATNFIKYLASQQEIAAEFQHLLLQLKKINPKIKILFNVSPVRYIRDGLSENTISKSMLHLAITEIVSKNSYCYYFPSYEIVIDELRDYRFYKEDMVHPNQLAIEYIYEVFSKTMFDDETLLIVKDTQQLNSFLKHKMLNSSAQALEQHKHKLDTMVQSLQNKYPFLSPVINQVI